MYKHLFFDMDLTIAPARTPILPSMFKLLSEAKEDIIIVSGQDVEKIKWQSNNLHAFILGQNGNHAETRDGTTLWNIPLEPHHRDEILDHISEVIAILDHEINYDWNPIEDRGAQITFSPIGNTAPVEQKMKYDPDRKKRDHILRSIPFASKDLVVKIGGSTSLDYIHKDRHKGTNVAKLIELMNWNKDECIYYGDGLYPGGNDEAVIGVIETVLVNDHLDTETKIRELLKK
jgi:phosphomannomutase